MVGIVVASFAVIEQDFAGQSVLTPPAVDLAELPEIGAGAALRPDEIELDLPVIVLLSAMGFAHAAVLAVAGDGVDEPKPDDLSCSFEPCCRSFDLRDDGHLLSPPLGSFSITCTALHVKRATRNDDEIIRFHYRFSEVTKFSSWDICPFRVIDVHL
jgi:hypothetical protein